MPPIEEGKSDLIHDRFAVDSYPASPQNARGRIILATGTLANTAAALSSSTYHLADLPSNCLLHHDTFFDVENDGFAQIVIGTKTDTDAFVDVARSAGNIVSPIAQGDVNHGKELWEILGFAADPGGVISLYKHAEADATGAGTMPFQIAYITA